MTYNDVIIAFSCRDDYLKWLSSLHIIVWLERFTLLQFCLQTIAKRVYKNGIRHHSEIFCESAALL